MVKVWEEKAAVEVTPWFLLTVFRRNFQLHSTFKDASLILDRESAAFLLLLSSIRSRINTWQGSSEGETLNRIRNSRGFASIIVSTPSEQLTIHNTFKTLEEECLWLSLVNSNSWKTECRSAGCVHVLYSTFTSFLVFFTVYCRIRLCKVWHDSSFQLKSLAEKQLSRLN